MPDILKEIWKNISIANGYQVSSIGRVRSIDRIILTKNNQIRKYRGKLMKQSVNENGYFVLNLGLYGSTLKVHQLVAMAFLNSHYKDLGLVVDHIDGNTINNCVDNLRVVTQHENSLNRNNRSAKSGLTGVSRHGKNRWKASMYLHGENKHIGTFKSKEEAGYAYRYCLKIYKNIDYVQRNW